MTLTSSEKILPYLQDRFRSCTWEWADEYLFVEFHFWQFQRWHSSRKKKVSRRPIQWPMMTYRSRWFSNDSFLRRSGPFPYQSGTRGLTQIHFRHVVFAVRSAVAPSSLWHWWPIAAKTPTKVERSKGTATVNHLTNIAQKRRPNAV